MSYSGVQPVYGTFPSDLFTGNGSNTVFTMSSVPGNKSALLVTVDGVRQHTDTYSYTANTLTFSEAPGSGAIIETVNMGSRADIIITEGVYKKTQFTATAAQTNFTIATGYTVGFVDVYLNGIRLVVADDFTATDGSTVILATPAASGDSVEVVAYGTFNVANALLKSGDTMSGNLVVSGTSTLQSPVAIANTTGNTFVIANTGAVTITGNVAITGNSVITGYSNVSADSYIAGNLLVGTGSASGKLTVLDNSGGAGAATPVVITNGVDANFYVGLTGSSATDKRAYLGPSTGTALAFQTNGTERVRIDSSGNVFVGGSTPNTATKPVYSSTTAKAWAYLTYASSSSTTIASSFNVSSVSTAPNDYVQINFTSSMPSVNYAVVTGIADNANYLYPPFSRQVTTGFVQLSVRYTGGGATNFANMSLACFA